MTDQIRIIKHEAVPSVAGASSSVSEGKKSRFFYWDDVPGRRTRRALLTSEEALELAKAFLRAERDRNGLRHER